MVKKMFERYIGIDYSGACTPVDTPVDRDRFDALAVYCADGDAPPQLARPRADASGSSRWTRRKIAEWLVEQLQKQDKRTLVGIDHAFSFPIDYFQQYNSLCRPNWDHFLYDFRKCWPTDKNDALVKEIRNGTGRDRSGNPNSFRLTDRLTGTAKSVFHFNIPGQVAPATHAGLPWLWYIRKKLGYKVHFWPFDGWDIPKGKTVIAEVYPALWKWRFERAAGMSDHQHDAYSIAGWLSYADQNGWLAEYLDPDLSPVERKQAEEEGWILGVLGYIRLDQDPSEAEGNGE